MNRNCLHGILLFVSTQPTCPHCLIVVYYTYCLLEVISAPDNGRRREQSWNLHWPSIVYVAHCPWSLLSVPLQAWSGPEGSRNLRLPDFMTPAQDGGKVVSLTHRPPLPPGNAPGTHFCYRMSRPQGHSAIGKFQGYQLGSNQRPSDL